MEKLLTTLIKSLIGIAVLSLLLSAAVYFYGSHMNHCCCGTFLCFFIPACLIVLVMIFGIYILWHTVTDVYQKQINDLKKEITELKEKYPTDEEIKYRDRLLEHEENMAKIKYQHCCCPKKEN